MLTPSTGTSPAGDREDYDYSRVFERIAKRMSDWVQAVQKDRDDAGPLLAELLATPLPGQRQIVATDPRYWTPALRALLKALAVCQVLSS